MTAVVIRHKHITYLYKDSVANVTWLNRVSSTMGVVSFLGLMLVADFQASSSLANWSSGDRAIIRQLPQQTEKHLWCMYIKPWEKMRRTYLDLNY